MEKKLCRRRGGQLRAGFGAHSIVCAVRWRSAGTLRLLAAQQMPARHEQIGQRAGHEQGMSVLLEPAITHLGEAEHPLDDPDRVFDPRFREGRLLARTLDLVRFFARSISSITSRWR